MAAWDSYRRRRSSEKNSLVGEYDVAEEICTIVTCCMLEEFNVTPVQKAFIIRRFRQATNGGTSGDNSCKLHSDNCSESRSVKLGSSLK